MLLEMGTQLKKGEYFVFTSNVDGHFQKAGFPEDKVVECHGSIHYAQCNSCGKITPMSGKEIPIDYKECVATSLPQCVACGCVIRPNILMFGDYDWMGDRTERQNVNYYNFLKKHR
jgi:NAD-dependent SIR2 family protein deacetylase